MTKTSVVGGDRVVRAQLHRDRGVRGVGDPLDEAGVDEADERDEAADTRGDRGLELVGDGVEDRGAEPGDGEQHDDDASITTRPIASGHVTCGAIDTASRLLMPRPVAMAKG